MTSGLNITGDHPLARGPRGKLKSRIGTIFPAHGVLVTKPGIHATQRRDYLEMLGQERAANGLPPLTELEDHAAWNSAVDLLFEADTILIRPDPDD
ncbi:MAG: hypothetical protein ACYTG0_37615, partial [Planctomycetota bacterium]